jgi:hypothetical protein
MSGFDEQVVEDGVFEEVEPACVAMVPLAPAPPYWARKFLNPRPDPTFVAHLIATAEQLPQTRSLRRATPADALSAYRSVQHAVKVFDFFKFTGIVPRSVPKPCRDFA